MRILLDTNVLCRLADRAHPHHAKAQAAVASLRESHHELCLVPQVIYEYWVVATRPIGENGLGMSPSRVHQAIEIWLKLFTLLRDERGVFGIWQGLVAQLQVKGKRAHDTRLVAAMKRHGLEHLITFNVVDFERYPDIEVLDAQLVAAT